MKKLIYSLGAALLFACQPQTQVLEVNNESDLALSEKPVRILRADLEVSEGLLPLLLLNGKDTLAAQLDDVDGDGKWDELFFLTDLAPKETQKIELQWVKELPAFEKRTSVRFGVRDSLNDVVKPKLSDIFYPHELPWINGYQPYQTDGPSWENDKVGFRSYLDGRNSKDVFGKRVSYMSPDDVGINADGVTEDLYHTMADWGRDILSVGNSLGVGGYSLLIGEDRLRRIGVVNDDPKGNVDSTIFTIYQEGPIRSIINFEYKGWRPENEDRVYTTSEKIETWPGFYGYKNTVQFEDLKGDETLIVGLVNSRTNKPLHVTFENEDWVVLSTHDMQTYEKEWYLGLALVVPKKDYLGYFEASKEGKISTTYLAKFKLNAKQPLSYYTLACWELHDVGFRDEKYFRNYLIQFTQQLSASVKVKVLKK